MTATIGTLQREPEDENVNAKSKEHEISATTERHSKVPNVEGKQEIVPMTSMELEHYLKAESTATSESQKAQEQQDKDRELIEFLNNNMERMIRARERDHMKQDEVMDRVGQIVKQNSDRSRVLTGERSNCTKSRDKSTGSLNIMSLSY